MRPRLVAASEEPFFGGKQHYCAFFFFTTHRRRAPLLPPSFQRAFLELSSNVVVSRHWHHFLMVYYELAIRSFIPHLLRPWKYANPNACSPTIRDNGHRLFEYLLLGGSSNIPRAVGRLVVPFDSPQISNDVCSAAFRDDIIDIVCYNL